MKSPVFFFDFCSVGQKYRQLFEKLDTNLNQKKLFNGFWKKLSNNSFFFENLKVRAKFESKNK